MSTFVLTAVRRFLLFFSLRTACLEDFTIKQANFDIVYFDYTGTNSFARHIKCHLCLNVMSWCKHDLPFKKETVNILAY